MKINIEETNDTQMPFNNDVDIENRAIKHWSLLEEYRQNRNQQIRFLSKNGVSRNILDYVQDSVDRMNERHLKAAYKEDWQSNTFDPITRNKTIFILGMMAATRMSVDLVLKPLSIFTKVDYKEKKRIFEDFLEQANDHNRDDQALIREMFGTLSEGSYIGFEDFKKGERTKEEVVEFDPDTGEKTTRKVTYDAWDDVYGTGVPINEFYPETIWTSNFDDIHRAFRVREMSEQGFHDVFDGYEGAKEVKNAGFYRDQDTFNWGIGENVEGKNIQVVYFYDEIAGKMGIWANMVEIYYGPMPWNHGKLPFWFAQGEPIHNQFLYGKSLPDKLMSMQDMNNSILNAMLDQLFMSLNSPIFVDGMVNLDDGYMEPNAIVELSPGARVQRSNLGNIDQTSYQMLELLRKSMELSSVSSQSQGIPTGGRKTKYEVQQLQEGATQIAGLFLQLFEGGYARKYELRLKNKIQYLTMPSRKKSGKRQYKYIELEGRKLANGKIGKRMIQVMGPGQQPPSQDEMKGQMKEMTGEDYDPLTATIQPIYISKDYLKNGDFDLDVKIVPNSSLKESEFMRKQRAKEYFQITAENQGVDQQKNLENFTEAMEQPADLVKEPQEQQENLEAAIMQGMQGQGGMPQQGSPAIDINQDLS